MSIGTQFSDSSNEANIIRMGYGQPSSSIWYVKLPLWCTNFKRYMHGMLEFLTNIIKAQWVGTNIVSNSKTGFLHLPIPLNHIDPHFVLKGHCNVICTNYWYLMKSSLSWSFIMSVQLQNSHFLSTDMI